MYSDPMHLPDPVYQAEFYEGVAIKRLLAWVVDVVLILVLTVIAGLFTVFIGFIFFPLFFTVTSFFYRWLTIASGSATWGMRLMAIELRDMHGARLDNQTAMLHTAGFMVSTLIFPLQLISMALMGTTERGQGLTDHVLGTAMINRRAL